VPLSAIKLKKQDKIVCEWFCFQFTFSSVCRTLRALP